MRARAQRHGEWGTEVDENAWEEMPRLPVHHDASFDAAKHVRRSARGGQSSRRRTRGRGRGRRRRRRRRALRLPCDHRPARPPVAPPGGEGGRQDDLGPAVVGELRLRLRLLRHRFHLRLHPDVLTVRVRELPRGLPAEHACIVPELLVTVSRSSRELRSIDIAPR